MNYDQRMAIIKGWLGGYLLRKATPRRLDTAEAVEGETAAINKALNKAIHADANADQMRQWLDAMGERLDLQKHTSWPSIGEMVEALRLVIPARERPTEEDPESRGREMANEWLRSPAGRDACLEGYHVNAAQWIKNRARLPNEEEMAAIRESAEKVREEVIRCAQETKSGPLAAAIARSAVAIERRRISVYEKLAEFHQLSPDPEWRAIDVDAAKEHFGSAA